MDVPPGPLAASRRRRLDPAVIGIGVAALVLRLLHLRAVRPLLIDTAPPPGMDRWLNMEVAAAIARGEWLGGWAVPYDSSPGYSYVLAALYRASGQRWIGPAAVQLVLGAVAPILLAGVVRRLRDDRTAVVAALLGALYLPAIFYEGLLVKFSLVPVVASALLYATVRLRADLYAYVLTPKPDGLLVMLGSGTWIIPANARADAPANAAAEFYLSGTFTPPADHPSALKYHIWQGTLKLPKVKIPQPKAVNAG